MTSVNLEQTLQNLYLFSTNENLTDRIADIEHRLVSTNKEDVVSFLYKEKINAAILGSALKVKEIAGQINVIIHSLGMLIALPYILEPKETIVALSLGAGNTGKRYDLETNKRIAEFKFIAWQGGPESIRQNSLFVDLFNLSEDPTPKEKYVYVIDKKIPIKFLKGRRDIKSVFSKNQTARDKFFSKYGNKFLRVFEYYDHVKDEVTIVELGDISPVFSKKKLVN